MIALPDPEQIPIRRDKHGRLRVGNTRVLLDLIVYAFWRGATPETIVDSYPSLSLSDVYLALGYYLLHQEDIDAYLRREEADAEAARREHETTHPRPLTREVLMARLEAKRKANDSLSG